MNRANRQEYGWSLIELLIAMVILAVAVIGMVSALLAAHLLVTTNREDTLALEAARRMVEDLQSEPFSDILARYNADPADDPAGPGTAPGPNFAVSELDADPNDTDGFLGEVEFPTTGGFLDERLVDAALGLPRDLNSDGDANDLLNHIPNPTPYSLLPLTVRVRWLGSDGQAKVQELRTLLVSR